jgi:DHA2 family multidrug resistance protein
MMLTMLLVGRFIAKIGFRSLLTIGIGLMAAGLAMLSAVQPEAAVSWLVIGSTLQSVGGGMLFTGLSTLGFATLAPDLRTDAAGLYSLLRQLGCASGVALMTAVLRWLVDANLVGLGAQASDPGAALSPQLINSASLLAYKACFQAMAVAALTMIPGIWLFRLGSDDGSIKDAL